MKSTRRRSSSRACWPAPIPSHADYWGGITDRDQRIAEAADVALALWLSRATVWDQLDASQRLQIATWLLQVNGKQIADNNWHLFSAQVNVALQALGADHDAAAIERHLARTLEFYGGHGWFTDGQDGPVDYYNAWGFYYHIGWIHRMNPGLLREIVDDALPVFAADLLHLLGPNGMPVFGRSVCYRMAVSAPLVFASTLHPESIAPAQARRALDLTWDFFLEHGALREGRVTQGYCGDDAVDPRQLLRSRELPVVGAVAHRRSRSRAGCAVLDAGARRRCQSKRPISAGPSPTGNGWSAAMWHRRSDDRESGATARGTNADSSRSVSSTGCSAWYAARPGVRPTRTRNTGARVMVRGAILWLPDLT